MLLNKILLCFVVQPLNLKVYRSHYEFFNGEFLIGAMYYVESDQPPEAANELYWFEKVPYLLC